jgi:hypothetical protein
MSDDYPPAWIPWIKCDDEPVKVDGRASSSMRSGCPDTIGWHEDEPDAYPQKWRR